MPTYLDEINAEREQQGLPPVVDSRPTSELNFTTGANALGIGVSSVLNNLFFGGLGQAYKNIGNLVEYFSPSISQESKNRLIMAGYTPSWIEQRYPQQDSLFTQYAREFLAQGVENQNAINEWEQKTLGSNPTTAVKGVKGVGTTLPFLIAGLMTAAAGGSPLLSATAMGTSEAASESGETMFEAQRRGLLDNGGLSAANKVFASNAVFNSLLDYGMGRFSPLAGKVKDPLLRWGTKGALEVGNELIQEPSQEVMQQAAINSMTNGTGYLDELWKEGENWPEYFKQLAPEVALSTLITNLATGGLGSASAGFPGSIRNEYHVNNTMGYMQKQAPQVQTSVNNFINENLSEQAQQIQQNTKGAMPPLAFTPQQRQELSNLQSDIEQVIENITPNSKSFIGYNNPDALYENLTHLENIRETIANYGKSAEEIKAQKMQEIQEQQAKLEEERKAKEAMDKLRAERSVLKNTSDIMEGAENNTDEVTTSAGTKAKIRNRVVPAEALITSHDENGNIIANYPQEYQARDRSSLTSLDLINSIGNKPDPKRLVDRSYNVTDGAPVVDKFSNVISGNARTLGLLKAYKQGTAENYKEYLIQNAGNFGLNPEYIKNTRYPVLVREITGDINMEKFAAEANEASTTSYSSADQAMQDAKRVMPDTFTLLDERKSLKENSSFVTEVLKTFPSSEISGLLTRDGNIDIEGFNRVQRMLAAQAYKDKGLVGALGDTTVTGHMKVVNNALLKAAPTLAKFNNSDTRSDLLIAEDIAQAYNILQSAGKETVESKIGTSDLFTQQETTETFTDEAKKLALLFGGVNQKGKQRSETVIKNALIDYANMASQEAKVGQNSLLDDSFRESKAAYLDKAISKVLEREARGEDTSAEIETTAEVTAPQEAKIKPDLGAAQEPQMSVDNTGSMETGQSQTQPQTQIQEQVTEQAHAKATQDEKTGLETEIEIKPERKSKPKTKPKAEVEETLRQEVENQILAAKRSSDEARAISEIYIEGQKTIAKAAGISLEDSIRADGLKIEYKSTLPRKDKSGHVIGHDKANINFRDGETIIKVSKLADESSIAHELGHLFLNKLKNLDINRQLKGVLKKDFDNMLAFYEITTDDIASETNKYIDAQEKFATDLVRYLRKGFAPTSKLKHTFELFKKWLKAIYTEAKSITYRGADGKDHKFSLNKDVRKLFDHLLGGEADVSTDTSTSENADTKTLKPSNKKQTNETTFHQAAENPSQMAEEAQHWFKDWLTAKNYTSKAIEKIKAQVHEEVDARAQEGAFKLAFRDLEAEKKAKEEAEAKARAEEEAKKKKKRSRKSKKEETGEAQEKNTAPAQTATAQQTGQSAEAKNNATQTQGEQASNVINPIEEKTTQNGTVNEPEQNSPDISNIGGGFTWGDPETERRYKRGDTDIKPGIINRIKHTAANMVKNFGKGSYAELQQIRHDGVNLYTAKTILDKLDRNIHREVDGVITELTENLRGLETNEQKDMFKRKRLADNLAWRISDFQSRGLEPPKLPYGWTVDTFKKDYARLNQAVANDEAIKNAIEAEEKTIARIGEQFIDLAGELGYDVSNKFRNPHYFHHAVYEYIDMQSREGARTVRDIDAKALSKSAMKDILGRGYLKEYKGSEKDISSDYWQITGEVRIQLITDIETMKALRDLKNEYDITGKIRKDYEALQAKIKETEISEDEEGQTFHQVSDENMNEIVERTNRVIPEGYSMFSPAGSGLLRGTNTATENAVNDAFNEVSDKSGVPFDDILTAIDGLLNNNHQILEQSMIIPDELKTALKKLARRRNRLESTLGKITRKFTSIWKATVIYSPSRVFKYNIRNYTGDLDAYIAGLGIGKRERANIARSFKELRAHWKSKGAKTTEELKAYLNRSEGRMKVHSLDIDNNLKVTPAKESKSDKLYKKVLGLPVNTVKKIYNWEVKITQYRENHLRYAAFLTFLQDMQENNGVPSRFGASNPQEILALTDIYDRAYEMANDLMGAYDKISDTGKEMRKFLAPFWSWQEVNAKRYCWLFKNGFRGDNRGAFLRSLAIAKSAKVPYYATNAIGLVTKTLLITALASVWNRGVMGDIDDKLPEDVIYRPHITIGEWDGKVRYFDRIGSLADLVDWLGLDSFFLDLSEKRKGQLSLAQWGEKILHAPVNKALSQINFILKLPIEIATVRSLYPDAFNSRTISDRLEHVARSFTLEWPYKALRRAFTHKSYSDADEIYNFILYSIDPKEAAYFNTIDKVKQFKERVLDKHFDGTAYTKRWDALRNYKTALRYKDYTAAAHFMRLYRQLEGTKQGFKQSMKAMHPLFGMNKKEKEQFLQWITPQERRKLLPQAEAYYRELTRGVFW